jgi:hypothetical protein
MRSIGQWFRRRFKELDLLEDYFPLLFTRWQAALWGGSVLAVAFGWHFVTADWPYPVRVTACVAALFFAGYYVWRADHVRLMPKLSMGDISMTYTGTGVPNQKRRYVQVLVKCETEGPINNCRGQLLRVSNWVEDSDGLNGKWEATHLAETLDLLWSFVDEPTLTLEHGAPRRLNLFYVENTSSNMVIWTKMRAALASIPNVRFKFDIRIAGEVGLPIYISVDAVRREQWDELTGLHLEKTNGETI